MGFDDFGDHSFQGSGAVAVNDSEGRQTPGVGPVKIAFHSISGLFGINTTRLAAMRPDVLIMHPGPINRGVEIVPDVADGPRSVILNQVTNGVAIRMAVLYLISRVRATERVDEPEILAEVTA